MRVSNVVAVEQQYRNDREKNNTEPLVQFVAEKEIVCFLNARINIFTKSNDFVLQKMLQIFHSPATASSNDAYYITRFSSNLLWNSNALRALLEDLIENCGQTVLPDRKQLDISRIAPIQ